ncbi:MAG: RluA family pseudouridine synthase [Flavobacteriales bacterium]|nr:RluA family pseudouridine synthase [Flavobacteriales bacterium]
MVVLQTHIVPNNIEEQRLYDYAALNFPTLPSRKAIKKAITRGEILVDGKLSSTGWWVKAGQKIELLESAINPPKQYELKLEVVYEDDFFAIINKPAGITVSGNQFRTIQNALIGNINISTAQDALRWPKPVHRLDNPTSGLLLVAKTASALVKLGQQFENKSIQKKYAAIVIGKTPESGTITIEVEGLPATTHFKLVKVVPSLKNEFLSLLELSPKTGRTHQIRIHLAQLGFPIMGDKLYGNEAEILRGKGLFLSAIGLELNHPITNELLKIEIPLPHKFTSLLERENRRWGKYNP